MFAPLADGRWRRRSRGLRLLFERREEAREFLLGAAFTQIQQQGDEAMEGQIAQAGEGLLREAEAFDPLRREQRLFELFMHGANAGYMLCFLGAQGD